MRMQLRIFLTIPLFLLASYGCTADGHNKLEETYQIVASAIEAKDLKRLESYMVLQKGLSFGILEQKWSRAKVVFGKIYPPLEEVTILRNFEAGIGRYYWIVEQKKLLDGMKQIKSYEFTSDSSNGTGWKISATDHSGSYTYPDKSHSLREKIVGNIAKKLKEKADKPVEMGSS